MSDFGSFIHFLESTGKSDDFRMIGSGIDSRVWLDRKERSVYKIYNCNNSKISPETLLEYHRIQSQYALGVGKKRGHISETGRGFSLCGERIENIVVNILELTEAEIFYGTTMNQINPRLISKVPYVRGTSLGQVFNEAYLDEFERLAVEDTLKNALRDAEIPIVGREFKQGYQLTQDNVSVTQVENGSLHLTVTDLGADISQMVDFELSRGK